MSVEEVCFAFQEISQSIFTSQFIQKTPPFSVPEAVTFCSPVSREERENLVQVEPLKLKLQAQAKTNVLE